MSTRTLLNSVPTLEQCEGAAEILKSLAHPHRLQLLCYLAKGEKTVSQLEELCQVSQSQLSQFLQRMKRESLVHSRREGKYVFYSIKDRKVFMLIRAMHKVFCP